MQGQHQYQHQLFHYFDIESLIPNNHLLRKIDKHVNLNFDVYFSNADEIYFYWNDELTHGKLPKPCAKLLVTSTDPILTILNETDWINFCKKYLQDIQSNNIEMCRSFEKFIPNSLLENKKTVEQSPLRALSIYNVGINSDTNVINATPTQSTERRLEFQ